MNFFFPLLTKKWLSMLSDIKTTLPLPCAVSFGRWKYPELDRDGGPTSLGVYHMPLLVHLKTVNFMLYKSLLQKEHPTFWTARLKTNILCPIESILCLTRSLPSCGHPVGPLGILRNSWTTVASWVAKWVVATRHMAAASVHLGWGRKAPQSTQPELVGFRAFRSSLSLVPTPLHTHTHTHKHGCLGGCAILAGNQPYWCSRGIRQCGELNPCHSWAPNHLCLQESFLGPAQPAKRVCAQSSLRKIPSLWPHGL